MNLEKDKYTIKGREIQSETSRPFSYIITSRVNRLTVNSRFFYSYTSKALELAFLSDDERCFFTLRSPFFVLHSSFFA